MSDVLASEMTSAFLDHRILAAGPHAGRMEIAPSYAAVLREVTTKPVHEDRPGELFHNQRRQANRKLRSDRALMP